MADTEATGFLHRGVIEGFYGPPYDPADRLWLVEQLGRWGMNRYVYAPKNDPLQREEWRRPYEAEALADFAALIEAGARVGVEVGFAISPGLSMEYSSAADREALAAKLRAFQERGARFFSLALDDVPSRLVHAADQRSFGSLAEAHAQVAHALREALGPDGCLWLVPTDYVGTEPTDYLETLGAELAPEIEVGWTGRTVVSPTIPAGEAARRAASLGRRLLLWDNVPVSDGPMRPMLHLGPYRGRDAELPAHLSGVLLNTMQHPRASAVAVHTAAAYLRDPAGYEAEDAWQAALEELGAGSVEAFRSFAEAHRFSPSSPDDRDRELEGCFAALREAAAGGRALDEALEALAAGLSERLAASETLRGQLADRRLAAELEPWLVSHHDETTRMQRAVDLLRTLGGQANRMEQVLALFRFEASLMAPPRVEVSYGPRRILYPQLASLREDGARLGPDPAFYRDLCLTDEILDFAEARAVEQLGPEASPTG